MPLPNSVCIRRTGWAHTSNPLFYRRQDYTFRLIEAARECLSWLSCDEISHGAKSVINEQLSGLARRVSDLRPEETKKCL